MSRSRAIAAIGFALVVSSASGAEAASATACRNRATGKAAGLYHKVVREFRKCSEAVAAGGTCSAGARDARVQTERFKAIISLIASCKDPVAIDDFDFVNDDDLSVQVAGTAQGEARFAVDRVLGRSPGPMTADDLKCAKALTRFGARAAKRMIKRLMKCGASCTAADTAKVDEQFARSLASIGNQCTPASIAALLSGDTADDYLDDVRTGAQRVVDSLTPRPKAQLSVVAPNPPGSIVTPPGLPASVDVVSTVANVPNAGYVTDILVNGEASELNDATQQFEHDLSVPNPGQANYPIFLKAVTSMGVLNTSTNVKFNLGTLAPDVVITSPASGTITAGSSVNLAGQVIGDLGEADVLLVGGSVTSFNPDGTFTKSVSLGSQGVQILEASVQSFGLGTTNRDSIVVLKGTALPLGSRVPDANTNRLNNSGFGAVTTLIQSFLNPAFDPSNYLGQPAAGGTVCGFSTGSKTANIFAAGPNTVQTDIGINSFSISVCDVDTGVLGITCDASYSASNLQIFVQADLQPSPAGDLSANVYNTDVNFTGGSAELSGNVICDFVDLFIGSLESDMETELGNQLATEFPNALNAALAGIDVSGPIGSAINVNIDASYDSIIEDSGGVTFNVDSNVIALAPVPDAPAITHTLVPNAAGPPVLGPNVPMTSQPYDLAFCLSDGFINRTMSAFMLQGMFNQALSELPDGNGGTIPISTAALSFLFGDPAYNNTCNNCPVTLILKPSAAAVARAPQGSEAGDVVLVVPNYQLDAVADDGGTPVPLISASLTFELPLTLGALGQTISPTIGELTVSNFKLNSNPINANPATLETQIGSLFPLAASALGGLFGEIPLPPFEGLQLYGVGSGYNVSCAALYLSFSPPPPTPTPTRTRTFTPTFTPTPTRTPTNTQSPLPTSTPGSSLGVHTMTLASTSRVNLQSKTLLIPFVLTGSVGLTFSGTDGQGVATVTANSDFDPINVGLGGIDKICLRAPTAGTGVIDCDGGSSNIDITALQDHNTTPAGAGNSGSGQGLPDDPECDDTATQPNGSISTACLEGSACSPATPHAGACNSQVSSTESGTFAAGAMRLTQEVIITQLTGPGDYGPDTQPCTEDDTPPGAPLTATALITTGVATAAVFDANNVAASKIAAGETCGPTPCKGQVTGTALSCSSLRSGSFGSGKRLVTAFTGLDLPSPINDAVITLELISQ